MKLYPNSWVGFDLDRTLAEYHEWEGLTRIGKPIPAMIDIVKGYLAKGITCKIVTARVHPNNPDFTYGIMDQKLTDVRMAILDWCKEHIGQALDITYGKDMAMLFLYDDRAIQVEPNTGKILGKEFEL